MTYKRKETALKNLKNGENFLTKAFDSFREDYDCIKQALLNSEDITDSLSAKMLDDREIALLACKVSRSIYKNIKNTYQESDEFILANLNHFNGGNIPASFHLVDFFNDEMVTLITTKNPELLQNCPSHIRSNKIYVKLAYEKDRNSIKYADSSLLKDKPFVLDLMTKCPEIFDLCAFRDDIDVNEKLITLFPAWTSHASIKLTSNVEWMTKMIKRESKIFGYAPLEIRENKELLNLADLKNLSFSQIPYLLMCDKDVVLKLIPIHFQCYSVIPPYLQNDDDIIDVLVNSKFNNCSFSARNCIPPKYSYLFNNENRLSGKDVCEILKPVILNNKLSKELTDKPQQKQRTMKI